MGARQQFDYRGTFCDVFGTSVVLVLIFVLFQVIQRTLLKMERKYASMSPPQPLPPRLYLQLDNTARENRNRFVFAYLNMLIRRGVFKEIHVSFLPVGHTH